MTEVLLTLYCADPDGPPVASALRRVTGRAVHLRSETVFGHDFSDASTAERVSGQLSRSAIEVTLKQDGLDAAIDQIRTLKRAAPVRWHITPILSGGRLP